MKPKTIKITKSSDLYPHINVWVYTGFGENREKSIQSKNHYMNVMNFSRVLIIFLSLIIVLIRMINAEVYMGTCEGYVYNTENQNVSDATVIATVNTCSAGCSRETISEPSGYYMVANLNLPKSSMLTIYAEKNTALGLEYGTSQGTSNEFQAAEINVRICLPPPSPDLVNKTNGHETSATLAWTSYSDKKNYPVYDEFQLDSNALIRSNNYGNKNKDVNGLSFSNHIWRVRTCNNYCCSNWVYDYFTVGNSAPSPPVLSNQADTVPGQIILNWSSGIDSDADLTYDEYEFGIFGQIMEKIIPAKSPITQVVFGCNFYKWRIRTCEKITENLCSIWSEDSFFACGIECAACSPVGITCDSQGSGSTPSAELKNESEKVVNRYIYENTLYSMFVNSPQYVYNNENFHLKISFSTSIGLKDIIFKVNSSYFKMNDFIISELSQSTAKFNMSGISKDMRPGTYTLYLDVYLKGFKIISEPVEIQIKERRLEIPSPGGSFPWILIIVILIIIVMAYLTYRYLKKRNIQNSQKQ